MAPAGPEDLGAIFPMALILQEVSAEPEVEVPEAVREAYKLWRPTPLYRARRLEAELDTPARIYYKYEGVSPAGSHKPNTAVPQAYENAQAGIRKLTHGDRRGAVGLVAGLRLPALRPGVRGLHGRLVLRPEALPALDDADVGRDGAPLAVGGDRVRARQRRLAHRVAGHRDLRGRRGRRAERGHQLLARVGAQPRAAAPDRHRPGVDRPDGARRRRSPTSSSAASAAARTSPASPTRGCGASCAPAQARASSPPSRRRARRSPRASTPTTSATRPASRR